MTSAERAAKQQASAPAFYPAYRAPQQSGSMVVEPPPEQFGAAPAENRALRSGYAVDIQGRGLDDLAQHARADLVHAATKYTRGYRDVDVPSEPSAILLAGHQPELFHPGVWLKNFAISKWARDERAVAVNLIIDSDTLKTAAIRVPTGSVAQPRIEMVPFDVAGDEVPFEERPIRDDACWTTFGERAQKVIAPLLEAPALVKDFWPLACQRHRHSANLGECLAQSRHQWEGRWGQHTLELPQSQVCRFESFHWFTAMLLAQAERLRAAYNGAVSEYRRAHGLRSANHPVPDLAERDGWIESPLWIWRADAPRRRKVFVRQSRGQTTLSDRDTVSIDLPLDADSSGEAAAQVLSELDARGIRLRTRALMTTMFARLFLGDVFVHGIGGGKYDQLTDRLIERWFGLRPPRFVVVSGTLRLPIARQPVTPQHLSDVEHRLRELRYHPERWLIEHSAHASNGTVRELMTDKARWIAMPAKTERAAERHAGIERANEGLRSIVSSERENAERMRASLKESLRGEGVLSSREVAFCLYPEQTLRDFLLAFPRGTS